MDQKINNKKMKAKIEILSCHNARQWFEQYDRNKLNYI